MALKQSILNVLRPLRVALGKFIIQKPLPMTHRHGNSIGELWKHQKLLFQAASFVAHDKIEGDYLEFGVYQGRSFADAYRFLNEQFGLRSVPSPHYSEQDVVLMKGRWERMRFFAFDSFQGLPAITGVDEEAPTFVEGLFACSEEEFKKNIGAKGVPLDRVITVPGWYEDTLNEDTRLKLGIEKAAIIHVDCDLYQSAKIVLEFITPILVDGAILIFDDWFEFRGRPDLGVQRACWEWVATNPQIKLMPYQSGRGRATCFIVHTSDYDVAF